MASRNYFNSLEGDTRSSLWCSGRPHRAINSTQHLRDHR